MNKGLEKLKDIKKTYYDFFTRYDKEQFDIIEQELKRLEQLEVMYSNCVIESTKLNKAFDALSKDHEKAMKELSKEIEKNRALDIIRNIGILRPYETSGGQCWLETMCDATKITKDNYNLLKEAGL